LKNVSRTGSEKKLSIQGSILWDTGAMNDAMIERGQCGVATPFGNEITCLSNNTWLYQRFVRFARDDVHQTVISSQASLQAAPSDYPMKMVIY